VATIRADDPEQRRKERKKSNAVSHMPPKNPVAEMKEK
jgi:hypothetical protein